MRIKRLTKLPLKSLTLVTRLVSLNICWYPFVRIYIYLFEISPSVKCEWDETVWWRKTEKIFVIHSSCCSTHLKMKNGGLSAGYWLTSAHTCALYFLNKFIGAGEILSFSAFSGCQIYPQWPFIGCCSRIPTNKLMGSWEHLSHFQYVASFTEDRNLRS